jgi:MYXO-CTERM domain-containing protein
MKTMIAFAFVMVAGLGVARADLLPDDGVRPPPAQAPKEAGGAAPANKGGSGCAARSSPAEIAFGLFGIAGALGIASRRRKHSPVGDPINTREVTA